MANETFTPTKFCDILDRAEVRCPSCGRLLCKAFVLMCKDGLPPMAALAMEIKCPRCGLMVGFPIIVLDPE